MLLESKNPTSSRNSITAGRTCTDPMKKTMRQSASGQTAPRKIESNRPRETRVCRDGTRRGCYRKRTAAEDDQAFLAKVNVTGSDSCHEWQGAKTPMRKNSKGFYGVCTINGKRVLAHRYAYNRAHGPLPAGKPIVRHTCDNGLCCNYKHLVAGTHQDNMRDALERRRFATGDRSGSRTHPESRPRGENAPTAVLTAALVYLMRLLFMSQLFDQPTLASLFGIKNCSPILRGKSWQEVPMPPGYKEVNFRKIHRTNNGKQHRKATSEKVEKINALRQEGKTLEEIARVVGMSASRIFVLSQPRPEFVILQLWSHYERLLKRADKIEAYMMRLVSERKLRESTMTRIALAIKSSLEKSKPIYPKHLDLNGRRIPGPQST